MADDLIETLTTSLNREVGLRHLTVHEMLACSVAVEYLGSALGSLGSAERAGGDPSGLGALTTRLGHDCVDVADRAVPAQDRAERGLFLELAASELASAIRTADSAASEAGRRTLISRTVDILDPMLQLIFVGTQDTELRARLIAVHDLGEQVQRIAGQPRPVRDPAGRGGPRSQAGEIRARLHASKRQAQQSDQPPGTKPPSPSNRPRPSGRGGPGR